MVLSGFEGVKRAKYSLFVDVRIQFVQTVLRNPYSTTVTVKFYNKVVALLTCISSTALMLISGTTGRAWFARGQDLNVASGQCHVEVTTRAEEDD